MLSSALRLFKKKKKREHIHKYTGFTTCEKKKVVTLTDAFAYNIPVPLEAHFLE